MKADFEPWWKFEGWEEHIVTAENYQTIEQCEEALASKLQEFRVQYAHERSKENKYWAFWNEQEQCYCEGCEEDQQIYHGIMLIVE